MGSAPDDRPPTGRGGRIAHALQDRLDHPARSTRTTVVIGRLLGLALLMCFATGLYSHYLQDPASWMRFPTWPSNLYQITQGVHVATGIASIPLLLAKLWSVYPRLFQWPPLRSAQHAVERVLVGVLVAASLVEVTIGLLNTYQWYVFPFPFRAIHLALAWVVVGALAIHVAVQLPKIVAHWSGRSREVRGAGVEGVGDGPAPRTAEASRRGFLVGVGTATAAVVLGTAGQSFGWLRRTNLFGARTQALGPQGLPVNRTAAAAGVEQSATDAAWRLVVAHGGRTVALSRADLEAMPQREVVLPVACVEGWSTTARWGGVRLSDVMDLVGAPHDVSVRATSLQRQGGQRVSEMGPEFASHPATLVALRIGDDDLHLEHGYPARLIAPARPGVEQTKWLARLETT
ncbi:molybdopterin-dependent oxidoreductase [Luteimicrobium subarcticum]|uniref:Secreted protein n=1 Tax=Luteimicrobium subarcticum TaxID=620910 RepID=A0A2M8W1U8_9MICO|nr:molybdopterin-dependent oxidoreductase [Luteimicrobium subarcticum]PJI84886.1 secreted protein [Luteimicrobium subarcticum]